VGLPFGFFIGPGMPPILAQNDFLRAADLGDFLAWAADTGGFNVPPVSRLYEALPLAFKPPSGFLPALRCHAGDFAMLFLFQFASYEIRLHLRLWRHYLSFWHRTSNFFSDFLNSHYWLWFGLTFHRFI
jgi:hypothetical protein